MSANDNYKLDKNGAIELVKRTKDQTDKLFATDAKGNVDKSKSIQVSKGILNKVQSQQVTGEGKTYTYNFMKVGSSEVNKVFEFAANNSNVEWGMLKFSDGQNFISTTHEAGMNAGSNGILSDKSLNLDRAKLIEDDHSHPGGVHYPSGLTPAGVDVDRGGDIGAAKRLVGSAPNVRFNIYTPSDGQYTPYHSTDHEPDLAPVIITAPRRKKGTE